MLYSVRSILPAVLALSVAVVSASCAADSDSPTRATTRAPGATTQAVGTLSIPVKFETLDTRAVQYSYNKGYVNTLEVVVADSLGRHQAYVVCRNPNGSLGSGGGTVNVLFQNVAPGSAIVTVRTTFKQFIGEGRVLRPVSGSSTDFTLNDSQTKVTAVSGDLSSSALLVFAATDLGGTATAPSVLSYHTTNDNQSELTDTTATDAGYGVGAATGSVTAGNSTTVTIQVAQPPSLGSAAITSTVRQADAGDTISLPVANLQDGDQVLVVRGAPPSGDNDFVDLSKTSAYDIYPLTKADDTTATFVPTHATDGAAYSYYLSRGESLSYIGTSVTDTGMAKLTVYPGKVEPGNCTVAISSDDGTSTYPRRAGDTDTIIMTLRDAYNNIVTGDDFGRRKMDSWVWKPVVEPSLTQIVGNNASVVNPIALVPSRSLGTVTDPAYNASDKTWRATFTQGAVAPLAKGASASINVSSTTNVNAVSWLFDSSGLSGVQAEYTIGVMRHPLDANATNPRLWVSLFRGTSTSGTFVASGSLNADKNVAGATISIPVTDPATSKPVNMLVMGLLDGQKLTTSDDGTQFTVQTPTARAANDTDRVVFRIFQQAPNGNLVSPRYIIAGPGGNSGTYGWKQ